MKYSGVEWIGEIPENWKLNKMGQLFNLRNEKVSDKDYSPLSVSKGGIVPQMENVAKSDASDDRKLVLKGDFAINSRSDRKMSCGVSPLDGSVSLINTILYPKNDDVIYNDYMNYLLKNYGFAEEFYRWGHGIVADLWTTKWQEMKSIMLPLPSVQKQKATYDFLNQKTEEIDSLIEIENQQIEKLKEYVESSIYEYLKKELGVSIKDMSFESRTSMKKIGALSNLVTKQTGFDYSNTIKPTMLDNPNEDSLPYLQTRNFKNNYFNLNTEFYVPKSTWEQFPKLILDDETLLFSIVGASIGNVAIFPKFEKAFLGGAICRVNLVDKEYALFIKEIMLSKFGQEQINRKINSNAQGTITVQNVRDFLIPMPSKKDAVRIGQKCESMRKEVDDLITIKEKKIDVLTEYKKSLIYEYVTGKKEVC